jgi:lysophospholipase L1-like esterase
VSAFPYDPRAGLYVGGRDFGLPPAPAAPGLDDEAAELLVRFEHPAKFLGVLELPGAAALGEAAIAAAYALAPARVAALRAMFAEQARAAASSLDASGLAPGVVVALGDSITDDLVSWAEILRWALDGRDGAVLVNAGVSGDTTADVLRRLHGVVALRPSLVITMLGTNDCQRHGPSAQRLMPAAATRANLAAIAGWLQAAGARTLWIAPPPVDEAALARAVGDRLFSMRDADTAEVAAMLAALGGPVIDVRDTLRDALLPDGVHPTLAGQTRIAAAVAAATTR